jgi:hypothetical protein
MARAIYHNLKPNGKLVAVINNPNVTEKHLAAPERYGICMRIERPIYEGAMIAITFPCIQNHGQALRILNYHWSKETYERVLKKVGFQKIQWHAVNVSEEGVKEYSQSYWQEYLFTPHITVLECCK